MEYLLLNDIIYAIVLGIIGGLAVEENLKEISSAELKEMYEKNKTMKDFLNKEYKRLRGKDD